MSPLKGKKQTEEHIRKRAETIRRNGKLKKPRGKRPVEVGKKISVSKMGHKVSEEQRLKQSQTNRRLGITWKPKPIGWEPWNKGLTKDTSSSLKKQGKSFSANYKSGKNKQRTWWIGKHHSEETKEKIRKNYRRSFNKKTSIEKIVEGVLWSLGVEFYPEHRFENVGFVDFWLPDANLVIECDGEYWHSFPKQIEKDIFRDTVHFQNGRQVLRLPERLIKGPRLQLLSRIGEFLNV